ncbi:hypothetical protein TYRP_010095 [Tyrophagus putrescentiae]|nr:hypothetical protein TYRP_010095 [Tyrophagus putrescentiae]
MKPSSPAADHQPFFFFKCVTSTRTGTAISFCSSGAAQKLASVSCFTSSFGRSSRMAPPSLPVAPCSRPWRFFDEPIEVLDGETEALPPPVLLAATETAPEEGDLLLLASRVQLEDLLLNKVLQIGGHLLWRLEVVPGESRPLGAKAEFAIWIERIPASGERHGNHTHRPQIHFGRQQQQKSADQYLKEKKGTSGAVLVPVAYRATPPGHLDVLALVVEHHVLKFEAANRMILVALTTRFWRYLGGQRPRWTSLHQTGTVSLMVELSSTTELILPEYSVT